LLALLAGLLRPSAGRLHVGGTISSAPTTRNSRRCGHRRRRDAPGRGRNLLPYLTAEQNVRFAQRARPPAIAASFRALARYSGWWADQPRPQPLTPRRLAPGERQRLALAVALASGPACCSPTSRPASSTAAPATRCWPPSTRSAAPAPRRARDPRPGRGGQMGRTVTIRDGRVGAEGRRGEDYAIVGRDGTIHLPNDVLEVVPPGTLLGVETQPDGTVLLIPAADSLEAPDADR
jgi:hypothetical protein